MQRGTIFGANWPAIDNAVDVRGTNFVRRPYLSASSFLAFLSPLSFCMPHEVLHLSTRVLQEVVKTAGFLLDDVLEVAVLYWITSKDRNVRLEKS